MKITENNYIAQLRRGNEKALEYVADCYGGLICSVVRKQQGSHLPLNFLHEYTIACVRKQQRIGKNSPVLCFYIHEKYSAKRPDRWYNIFRK